jgi:hypothetical protein
MKISSYGAAAASYGVSTPKKVQAQAPARSEVASELKPDDGFASSQLPPGVGENLNIKA